MTEKLAELALAEGMPEREFGGGERDWVVVEKMATVGRWVDAGGRGNELELRWFATGDFHWSMLHVIRKADGEWVSAQTDRFVHVKGGAFFEFLHKALGRKRGYWK